MKQFFFHYIFEILFIMIPLSAPYDNDFVFYIEASEDKVSMKRWCKKHKFNFPLKKYKFFPPLCTTYKLNLVSLRFSLSSLTHQMK